MSLDSLRSMRRAGRRPDSVVVIVGKPPEWMEDRAGIVVVDSDPSTLDLRALVGLPIHLIDIQSDLDLTLAAMDATEAAGVKVLGACSAAGSCGVDEKHENAMRRYRENLCQTR